ncbi:MAG: RNase J family beta-CASP ribonuclease [Clostridia bacterium]|nr:RNase J family beta-CASP ribonuclease [Clostridia bacterium]
MDNLNSIESIKNALKAGENAEKQLNLLKKDTTAVAAEKKVKKQPAQKPKANSAKSQPKTDSKQAKPQAKQSEGKQPKTKKVQPQKNQAEQPKVVTKQDKSAKVKITFLGGVGEIGKNMTAIEYKDEIIVVDCGLSFPGDDMPGIDVVVPDITYLVENKEKVKALILTHGHEDHIGSIPFMLPDVNVPIYASRLTLGLVENKLKEYPKLKYKLIAVKPKNVLKIGSFAIEFINVNHSIAGALALCISTPCGNIVHTGDFKIDFEPINGEMTDLIRFGELGKKGVNLLMCESTNVCKPGYTMSEKNVGRVLDGIFEKHPNNRLIVATFASNIHRMQQILDLAEKYKRKVAFSGRSMVNISEVAMKLGELKYNREIVVDIDKINRYPDNEILIMSTGSQGESMSALSRMASGDFKDVVVGENDCIILSASPIPGNEKSVYNIINKLFKKGCDVIYDDLADVHVSGHACQEEIKTIHSLIKPKHFIPIHGEYRHLKQHKELAMSLGLEARDIIIPDLGMQVEMSNNSIQTIGFVQSGQRLVDGLGVGDMSSAVLRDRKQLSEEGVCVAVINISNYAEEMQFDPFIITRGVVYNDEAEQFNQDARACLAQLLKEYDFKEMEQTLLKNTVKKALSNFIFRRTKRRPMILTVVLMN